MPSWPKLSRCFTNVPPTMRLISIPVIVTCLVFSMSGGRPGGAEWSTMLWKPSSSITPGFPLFNTSSKKRRTMVLSSSIDMVHLHFNVYCQQLLHIATHPCCISVSFVRKTPMFHDASFSSVVQSGSLSKALTRRVAERPGIL